MQYMDPGDAAEAQYHMDHQVINGREITVVFAEENRKKPQEMRSKERTRGRIGYGGSGRRRSPYYVRSRSRSKHSRSPRRGRSSRHSRSYSPPVRAHDRSYTPSTPTSRQRGRDSRSESCLPPRMDQANNLAPDHKVLYSPHHRRDAKNEPSGGRDRPTRSRSPSGCSPPRYSRRTP